MFCPGELYIVDLSSEGYSGEALNNDEWFHDPNFLNENEESWPELFGCSNTESEIALMETIKRTDKPTVHSLATVEKGYGLKGIGNVVDCRRYSSKTKLFRITAYLLKFIARIKKRTANNMSVLGTSRKTIS